MREHYIKAEMIASKCFDIIRAELAEQAKSHAGEIAALQAKIDALILEFCPDEMTQAQNDKWARSQKVSEPKPAEGLTDEEIKEAYASKKIRAFTYLWEPDVFLGMRAVIDAHEAKKAKPVRMLQCRWARDSTNGNYFVVKI